MKRSDRTLHLHLKLILQEKSVFIFSPIVSVSIVYLIRFVLEVVGHDRAAKAAGILVRKMENALQIGDMLEKMELGKVGELIKEDPYSWSSVTQDVSVR